MVKLELYIEDVENVSSLRTIRTGAYYISNGKIAEPVIYVRGNFQETVTRELIFSGTWFEVKRIGYEIVTLLIDGKNVECKPYDTFTDNPKFDVKISERA